MILKIYRILAILQVVGTTALGFLTFQITGTIVGFVAGVLIAGHFLTVINTRDINAENTKLLKSLLEEVKKTRKLSEQDLPHLLESKKKETPKISA